MCALNMLLDSPPLIYLGTYDVIHMIKWTRPSPSVLLYVTASNQKLDSGKAWEQG